MRPGRFQDPWQVLFPTVEFAIFFPIVLAISWALMSRQPLWKPFIVVASYVFYAAADPRFCLLLGAITLASQLAAVAIHRTEDERLRKWFCAAAVVFDLGILAIFKYYGFFVSDVSDVLDTVCLGSSLPLVTIALPVGVSFFSFQAVTYVVDVKRRQTEPANLLDAAIYLSFFPHLVAGPIVRASEFLPQLKEPRDPDRVAVGAGLTLIALGLIKKVMIADYLAREVVDKVFAVPQAYSAPDAILAAYAYAAQIFCDFSGYTDMAIGLALLLGFVFPQNFNSPYRATGFRDFWRRWHMTLSRFLRDYLYIPLGGNRKGKVRTYINLMITMLLAGLWHGANWTFVVWGALHGLYLCVEKLIQDLKIRFKPIPSMTSKPDVVVQGYMAPRFLRKVESSNFILALLTFFLINVTWVFFRSPDFTSAWRMLKSMFSTVPNGAVLLSSLIIIKISVIIFFMIIFHWFMRNTRVLTVANKLPWWLLGIIWSAMLILLILSQESSSSFIYFQ